MANLCTANNWFKATNAIFQASPSFTNEWPAHESTTVTLFLCSFTSFSSHMIHSMSPRELFPFSIFFLPFIDDNEKRKTHLISFSVIFFEIFNAKRRERECGKTRVNERAFPVISLKSIISWSLIHIFFYFLSARVHVRRNRTKFIQSQ